MSMWRTAMRKLRPFADGGDDRRREFLGVVDALATAASTVEIGYVRLTCAP
jgi:hypothetical protein